MSSIDQAAPESRRSRLLVSARMYGTAVAEGAVPAGVLGALILIGIIGYFGGPDIDLTRARQAIGEREGTPLGGVLHLLLRAWFPLNDLPLGSRRFLFSGVAPVAAVLFLLYAVGHGIFLGYPLGFLLGGSRAYFRPGRPIRKGPIRLTVFIGWVAANVTLALFLPGPIQYAHWMQLGEKQMKAGDPAGAVAAYTEALAIVPTSWDALWERAQAYRALDQLDQTDADYAELQRLQPERFEPLLFFLAADWHLTWEQDADKAVAWVNEGLRVCQKWKFKPAGDLYRLRAQARVPKGEVDLALADYTEAIRLNPEDAKAYLGRGIVYAEKKNDFDPAVTDLTEAIRLLSQETGGRPAELDMAYLERGWVYSRKGEFDKALADCTEAVRHMPEDSRPYLIRGGVYGDQGDYERAIADATESLRLNPTDAAYRVRGWAYLQSSEYAKAIADFTEAIRRNEQDAVSFLYRGMAHFAQKQHEQAVADLSQAITLNPKNAQAYWIRHKAYHAGGDLEHARADWDEANRLDPNLTATSVRP